MRIEDWLNIHFDPILASGGEDLVILCPFCKERRGSEDTSGHMYISTVIPACHCFRCDYSGSHYQLVMDYTGMSYHQAMEEMSEGIVPLYKLLRRQKIAQPLEEMPPNFLTLEQASKIDGINLTNAKNAIIYLRLRLSKYRSDWESYLCRWGVWEGAMGYGYLVIPIERGWWQVRKILKSLPGHKYISSSSPKEDRLYNYQALSGRDVLITEGAISAVCLGETAVALCGKTATPAQLERLGTSSVKRFTICLDSDAGKEGLALAKSLARYGKDVIIRIYKDGDPASSVRFQETEINFGSLLEIQLNGSLGNVK